MIIRYVGVFMVGFLLGMGLMVVIYNYFVCPHEYELTKTIEIIHYDEDRNSKYTEYIFVQTCKKCGKIKTTRVLPTGR